MLGRSTVTNATNTSITQAQCLDELGCSSCSSILAVLYSICGVLCIVGNALVLAAIYRTPHLHRISNYFIASLAAADFSVGLLVNPLWAARGVLHVWDNDHWLTLLCGYMSMQTATTTTFNLCAVSIDRYVAITKPFQYERIISPRRCKAIIAFIWVSSILLPIPRPLISDPVVLPIVWMIGSTVVVILPILTIFYCYFHIVRIARQQARRIRQEDRCENRRTAATRRSNTKAAWTVAIIIGVFLVTWTPSLILSSRQAAAEDACQREMLTRIWNFTVLLAFTSSAINPLIYTGRSHEYRNAFRAMFNVKNNRLFAQRADSSYTWATKTKDIDKSAISAYQNSEICEDKK